MILRAIEKQWDQFYIEMTLPSGYDIWVQI